MAVSAPRRADGREGQPQVVLNVSYVHALAREGLLSVVVPPVLDPAQAPALLDGVRGLVLTGGEDVHPSRYGAEPHPRLGETDPVRDAVELALFTGARARRVPVLGICRGLQLINVALGGTLYQDLPSERPGRVRHGDGEGAGGGCHDVRIEPGSRLHRLLSAATASVNSQHHQGIRALAAPLRATALAEDGLIEAVEGADEAGVWLLAVQWHPEELAERAVFRGFAEACA